MIKTYEDNRQMIYTDGVYTLSIVDERIVPTEGSANIPPEMLAAFSDIMDNTIDKPIVVADITLHTEVLGRFKSQEEAIEFVNDFTPIRFIDDVIKKDIPND